mmetsp:Transcript_34495/g.52121  ORF Transcript_34495/g.52121 Transcript_34495/m.52121 type:complete len:102 (-) Transcript_34495:1238-1543(-)
MNQGSIKSWVVIGVYSTHNVKQIGRSVVRGVEYGERVSKLSSIVSSWNEDIHDDHKIEEMKTASALFRDRANLSLRYERFVLFCEQIKNSFSAWNIAIHLD